MVGGGAGLVGWGGGEAGSKEAREEEAKPSAAVSFAGGVLVRAPAALCGRRTSRSGLAALRTPPPEAGEFVAGCAGATRSLIDDA